MELSDSQKADLIDNYFKSKRCLMLLDYDGTLVPFVRRPQRARPDSELLSLLEALCRSQKNEVVIISGRDRDTLERWLGDLGIGLVAEHGAWVRERSGAWEVVGHVRTDWKEEIRSILELYVERTPGSLVEEKEFSLAWHYRESDPELASARALELKSVLSQLTADPDVGVLEGSKVIEVKNMAVNKGRAALRWLSKEIWDFVLAMGDDLTDEDLFAALPESGYSVKVGLSASKARFNLGSVAEARSLLKELVSS